MVEAFLTPVFHLVSRLRHRRCRVMRRELLSFSILLGLSLLACHPVGFRLKMLVADKNFVEAAHHYTEHKDFFKGSWSDYEEQLKTVADNLNQSHTDSLRRNIDNVKGHKWPVAEARWPDTRKTFDGASELLSRYNEVDLLSHPSFRSPMVSELQTLVAELNMTVRNDAQSSFANFDHFGEHSFFERFPVNLDRKQFMSENFTVLDPRLQSAKTNDLQQFIKLYGDLDQAAFTSLSNHYLRSYIAENLHIEERSLADLVGAINAVRKSGFTPTSIPGVRIGFVEQVRSSRFESSEVQFPVRFDVDFPVTTMTDGFKEYSGEGVRGKGDFIILLDTVRGKVAHKSDKIESAKSEFLSGYRTDPNPNYYAAQSKVDSERVNLAGVKLRNALNPCTYCGWGALIVHSLAQGIAENAAQERLNRALEALKEVPPTIETPIYADYQFKRAFISSTKTVDVNCFVLDLRTQTFRKYTFKGDEKKDFEVVYQLNDKDRHRDARLRGTATQKDIEDWERSPVNVSLSKVLAKYVDEPTHSDVVIEALEDQIATERKRVLERRVATVGPNSISDTRFEKVVVIYNRQRSSIGSGFFVKPDVVLTNYHVIQDATYVDMKMYGGGETFGKVIKYDARLDLALIRVQSRGQPVEFYKDPVIALGGTVEAIGHPAGLEFSITRGVISAIRKQPSLIVPATGEVLTIQTDTPLNVGNSGSPLFLGDKVIGVVSFGIRRPNIEGLNFAVHYTEVAQFLASNLPD